MRLLVIQSKSLILSFITLQRVDICFESLNETMSRFGWKGFSYGSMNEWENKCVMTKNSDKNLETMIEKWGKVIKFKYKCYN